MSEYLSRFKALKLEIPSDEVLTKPTKPPFVSFDSNHDRYFSENTTMASSPSLVIDNKSSSELNELPTKAADITPAEIGEPDVTVTTAWPPEMRELIKWFEKLETPTEPFYLEPHIHVRDPEKFFESLRNEISIGRSCPRGKNGALLYDLKILRKIFH